MPTNVMNGYWGPADSNNQWFEERYVYSPYVSEFWNTISSFVFVFEGLRGLWTCWRYGMHTRYQMPYMVLIITGLGSALFHATSRWWAEILDEVPMIFLMASFAHLSRDHFPKINPCLFHFTNTAISLCILIPYLYLHNYEIFIAGFTLYAVYAVLVPWLDQDSAYAGQIYPWMIGPVILGRIVWESEQRLGIWWLHMVWHPLGAMCAMNGTKYFIIYQCEHLGVDYVCTKPPKNGIKEIVEAFWLKHKLTTTKI